MKCGEGCGLSRGGYAFHSRSRDPDWTSRASTPSRRSRAAERSRRTRIPLVQHDRYARQGRSRCGVYLEQPCLTYEECLAGSSVPQPLCSMRISKRHLGSLRQMTSRDGLVDLKISTLVTQESGRRVTALAWARDTLEDSWGGDIPRALLISRRARRRSFFTTTDLILCT